MTDQTTTAPRRRVPGAPPPPQTASQPSQEVAIPQQRPPPAPAAAQAPAARGPVKVAALAKAITTVMSEIGVVPKGGENKFHHYNYARMEDVLMKLTPLMGRHGIVVIQNEVDRVFVESKHVAVTYEFSIIHSSGETWPERPRFTGLAMARDSKGNFDDKCINKAHTAARKYFLVALFQIPTSDTEDADKGPEQGTAPSSNGDARGTTTRQRAPVPGPTTAAPKSEPKPEPKPEPKSEIDVTKPHRIMLGSGGGAEAWSAAYIRGIGHAKTESELTEWDGLNDNTLQAMSDKFPQIYETICAAVEARLTQLVAGPEEDRRVVGGEVVDSHGEVLGGMPSPKPDPTAAINWVAAQLATFKTYEAGEAFWNQIVAPREVEFSPVDFDVLLAEFRRMEARFMAPDDEPILEPPSQ